MRVAVIGLGYVGAVTSACLAELGHSVIGVDSDAQKVAVIEAGRSPIVEPGLEELIGAAKRAGRLEATTQLGVSVAEADVVVVCVGTPARSDGTVDLGHVDRVVEEIGSALADRKEYTLVVIRSTVPPGTVDGRVRPALERASGRRIGVELGLAMVPEFLREGSGVADFFDPPFTVAGVSDDRSFALVEQLVSGISRPIRRLRMDGAESLKWACNAFHAVKITFANEIGRVFKAVGVDAREVMDVFCQDDRLNISPAYLRPGFAFGGSCLPKDMRGLTHLGREHNVELPMIGSVMRSNAAAVEIAVRHVLDTRSRDVALLGLSFKAETDDLRESPFVELAETLIGKGVRLRIFDPIINPERLFGANLRYVDGRLPHLREILAESPAKALEGVSVAIVATRDSGTLDALVAAPPSRVIDLNGRLGEQVEALAGYEGIAW